MHPPHRGTEGEEPSQGLITAVMNFTTAKTSPPDLGRDIQGGLRYPVLWEIGYTRLPATAALSCNYNSY